MTPISPTIIFATNIGNLAAINQVVKGTAFIGRKGKGHILGIKVVKLKLKDAFWVKILSLNLFLTAIRKPLGQILHLTIRKVANGYLQVVKWV